MVTCDRIEPRLSEFADGTLAARDRAEVAEHLDACERCAGLLRDFERLRDAARGLGPLNPPSHVWRTLSNRLAAAESPSHRTTPSASRLSVARWAGIAATVAVVGGASYIALRYERASKAPSAGQRVATTAEAPASAADEVAQAMQHYDSAIAGLQATAASDMSKMEPGVAATLQKNLGVIDTAIAESRTAVTRDPASVAARDSLFEALQQKVSVLQDTVTLMSDARQPDPPAGPSK